ncbi:MAG: hypothetical protein ABL925_04040 [Methylococcales bacterium]
MNATVNDWLSKSVAELDDIYRNAQPGAIPNGDTHGTAILAGSILAKPLAFLAGLLAWQGKIFDLFCPKGDAGILVNKITPFSLTFIVAKVYRDQSWLDGRDTIVIDYSKTSFFAKQIRDEIREVEPGVYLGKVWWGKKRILDFALTRNAD